MVVIQKLKTLKGLILYHVYRSCVHVLVLFVSGAQFEYTCITSVTSHRDLQYPNAKVM